MTRLEGGEGHVMVKVRESEKSKDCPKWKTGGVKEEKDISNSDADRVLNTRVIKIQKYVPTLRKVCLQKHLCFIHLLSLQ